MMETRWLRGRLAILIAAGCVLVPGAGTELLRAAGFESSEPTLSGMAAAWPTSPKPGTSVPARDTAPSKQKSKPTTKAAADKGTTAAKADGESVERTRENSWSIVLMSFRDSDQEQSAMASLDAVRTRGGLPEAYIETRGRATVVAIGRYASADDPAAQAELSRVQKLEVEGDRPYAAALLAPPLYVSDEGSMPRYHLSMARRLNGDSAIQTLQVAVYGTIDNRPMTEKDRAEIRRSAEQAALILRQEGEEAYYYHGQTRSMVTIGAFTIEDFDPQLPRFKSSKLTALQKRHPYNLVNGAAAIERKPGERGPGRKQASKLVAIPDDE